MAECTAYYNVESLVLQQSLRALTTAIAADLTQVASKLFENHVISLAELKQAHLQTRTSDEKANELVIQVIAQVRFYPEKYDAFLKALEESDVQQKAVRDVRVKYEVKKKSKAPQDKEITTGTSSDGDVTGPSNRQDETVQKERLKSCSCLHTTSSRRVQVEAEIHPQSTVSLQPLLLSDVSADDYPLSPSETTDEDPLVTNLEVCDTEQNPAQAEKNTIPDPSSSETNNSPQKRACNNFGCKLALICIISASVVEITFIVTAAVFLLVALRDTTGDIVLGSSDVMRVLALDPSDLSGITFNRDKGSPGFAVTFYNASCSDIEIERQVLNFTRTLNATSGSYGLDDFYLVKDSFIHWFFLAHDLQYPSTCVAMVYNFSNHIDYSYFTSTGQVREATSYCIPSTSPLNFTLSAVEKDQHYFVGLESFVTTEFSYTMTGTVFKYNVSGLPPIRCSFPSSNCIITWSEYPAGEALCILAKIEGSNNLDNFVTLTYTARSRENEGLRYSLRVMLGLTGMLVFITFVACIIASSCVL